MSATSARVDLALYPDTLIILIMKILMLSPVWPLPATTGGLVRINRIFSGLAHTNDVLFISPGGKMRARRGRKILVETRSSSLRQPTVWRKLLSWIFSLYPYHTAFYWDGWMKAAIDEALSTEDFSCVYCHFIHTLPYVAGMRVPVVLDQQNVDRLLWRNRIRCSHNLFVRLFSLVNLYKTVLFENRYLRFVRAVVSVSERDKVQTQEFITEPTKCFIVAPNGASLDFPKSLLYGKGKKKKNNNITIGFMGSLDLELNRRAAQLLASEIFPALKKEIPECELRLLLIGRNPSPDIVKHSLRTPEIVVTGTVPDVRPYLSKVDIFVLPLRGGGGTKLRIFEAMAMQLPVIASPDAVYGIDGLSDGLNFLMASTTNEFCKGIIGLIKDNQLRRTLGKAGYALVSKKYSWRTITNRLAKDLDTLARS